MTSLDMSFIGVPKLILDGHAVQPRRRHSIAMLAYLVINKRAVSRSELATLLAGEMSDVQALKLLRNALTDLNAHGLFDYLITTRQSVAFNFDLQHTVDVQTIDRLYATAAGADESLLAAVAEKCDQELLKGMALRDGPEFESWLLTEREYRQQQMIAITQTLIARYQQTNRRHEAISLLRRLLTVEPWNEELHRELMRALARVDMLNEARDHYRVCRRTMLEELGVEPEPATTQLFETLQSGPSLPRNNFSAEDWQVRENVLGLSAMIHKVCSKLTEKSCRLVTLVGLRGSGKTSLATAVATTLASPRVMADDHPFPEGVVLVNLNSGRENSGTSQGDHEHIVDAIGLALGMAFYGNVDRMEQVITYLDRKRILLVLDGLEDIPGGVSIVRTLLRVAPEISILATSCDLLGVPDEWVYYVDGIEMPVQTVDASDSVAGQILLREMQRTQSAFRETDSEELKRICDLTGGLPLALKIVAGWLRAVPADEVIRQLEHGGELLGETVVTESGEVLDLGNLLSTEWNRLSVKHQQCIYRLAVFAGRFDFRAAAAVDVSLLNLLTLCRMRLIHCHEDDTYSLHPLIRLYCWVQRRLENSETDEPRKLHADYFATWIEQRSSGLREQPVEQDVVDRYLPDLIAAWEWAVTQRDITLLSKMLAGLAAWHSLAGKQRQWVDTLTQSTIQIQGTLEHSDNTEMRSVLAKMLLELANVHHRLGQLDLTVRDLQEARLQGEILDDPEFNSLTSIRYSQVLHARGKHHEVIDLLRQAREWARQAKLISGEAHAQTLMGLALTDYGQYARSAAVLREAEVLAIRSGQPVSQANAHLQLGYLFAEQGDYSRARTCFDQSLHIGREFLNSYVVGWSNVYLGRLFDDGYGQHREAARHLDMASGIFAESGDLSYGSYLEWARGRNAFFLGDLDRAAKHFEKGLNIGHDLHSPASKSRALTGLAQVALARRKGHSAESTAQLAYQLAADAGRRPLAIKALIAFGQAQAQLGRPLETRATFDRARSGARELGSPFIYCDAAAGLANVSLIQGDIVQAGVFAAEAFDYILSHSLAGCDNPAWITLACYAAFKANDDNRADEAVRRGADIILRRMETLDATSRIRYLEPHPHRRALLRLAQIDEPSRPVTLPA